MPSKALDAAVSNKLPILLSSHFPFSQQQSRKNLLNDGLVGGLSFFVCDGRRSGEESRQAVTLLSGFRFCLVYSRENGINCVFGKQFKLLKEWLPFHLSRICDTRTATTEERTQGVTALTSPEAWAEQGVRSRPVGTSPVRLLQRPRPVPPRKHLLNTRLFDKRLLWP